MPGQDEYSSKRPADTAFKQQRLPAWQPILSPPWVILCFFLVAIVFIPIGAVVIIKSNQVVEISIRYDDKEMIEYNDGTTRYTKDGPGATTLKWVEFEVPDDMAPPIFVYYKLTKFYQNHRRYSRSRSDSQLSGDLLEYKKLSDICKPFTYAGEVHGIDWGAVNSQSSVYSPCGLIAWSMFNDSIAIVSRKGTTKCTDSTTAPFAAALQQVANKDCETLCYGEYTKNPPSSGYLNRCTKQGIAWESDKEKKFKPAAAGYYNKPYYFREENRTSPTGVGSFEGHLLPKQDDEDFMVWMRTASLSTFRKLYRVFRDTSFKKGDKLALRIVDRYNVRQFGGEKWIVLTTTTWIGGKNYFLGISYVVVGSICCCLGVIFLVKHITTRSRNQ